MNQRLAACCGVLSTLFALPALATVTVRLNGTETVAADTLSLGAGNVSAAARYTGGVLQAGASGQGVGFFTDLRATAEGRLDAGYTVVGLAGPTALTFTWAFDGLRTWDTENASFGGGVGAGIFNQVGAVYIHSVGWDIGYVDGPPFMGDFAGVAQAPVRVTGFAGPESLVGADLPAGDWGGQGTVLARTHWTLDSGWSGVLSASAYLGVSGNVDADYGVRLLSVTRPYVAGPVQDAWLDLDNGTRIAVTMVPEPAPALLLAAGLAALGWRCRRR